MRPTQQKIHIIKRATDWESDDSFSASFGRNRYKNTTKQNIRNALDCIILPINRRAGASSKKNCNWIEAGQFENGKFHSLFYSNLKYRTVFSSFWLSTYRCRVSMRHRFHFRWDDEKLIIPIRLKQFHFHFSNVSIQYMWPFLCALSRDLLANAHATNGQAAETVSICEILNAVFLLETLLIVPLPFFLSLPLLLLLRAEPKSFIHETMRARQRERNAFWYVGYWRKVDKRFNGDYICYYLRAIAEETQKTKMNWKKSVCVVVECVRCVERATINIWAYQVHRICVCSSCVSFSLFFCSYYKSSANDMFKHCRLISFVVFVFSLLFVPFGGQNWYFAHVKQFFRKYSLSAERNEERTAKRKKEKKIESNICAIPKPKICNSCFNHEWRDWVREPRMLRRLFFEETMQNVAAETYQVENWKLEYERTKLGQANIY